VSIALVTQLKPDAQRMRANLEGQLGLSYAEAISFRLAEQMSLTDAQAQVKQLCAEAVEQGIALPGLIAREFPDIDWTTVATPMAQLGDAPRQARIFVKRVYAL
jgi:3-carboxy-cis,cis-muconate cycloisomerase